MMRIMVALDAALFLACIVATAISWAGSAQAASVAVACGGFAIALAAPIVVGRAGNWGVPGDGPRLFHQAH